MWSPHAVIALVVHWYFPWRWLCFYILFWGNNLFVLLRYWICRIESSLAQMWLHICHIWQQVNGRDPDLHLTYIYLDAQNQRVISFHNLRTESRAQLMELGHHQKASTRVVTQTTKMFVPMETEYLWYYYWLNVEYARKEQVLGLRVLFYSCQLYTPNSKWH